MKTYQVRYGKKRFKSGFSFERQPGPWYCFNDISMLLRLVEKRLIWETRLGDALLFALLARLMANEAPAILRWEWEKWFTAIFLQWHQSTLGAVWNSNKTEK